MCMQCERRSFYELRFVRSSGTLLASLNLLKYCSFVSKLQSSINVVRWRVFATIRECSAQCIQSITMPIPAQHLSRIYRPSCIFITSRVSSNFIHIHRHIRRLSKTKNEWKIVCSLDIHLHLLHTQCVRCLLYFTSHFFFSPSYTSCVVWTKNMHGHTGTGTEATSATSRIGIVTCWFIYKKFLTES